MILRILWQSALLLSGSALAAWGTWKWHPGAPALYLVEEQAGPGEITLADAVALASSRSVLWIDARKRDEFDKGHIPQAFLLNEYEWNDLVLPVVEAMSSAPEGQVIVIYCDAQKCAASKVIRDRMKDQIPAEREYFLLHGGWPAWLGRDLQNTIISPPEKP